MTRKQQIRLLKVMSHILLCLPLGWLVYLIITNQLGSDPAEKLVHELGFVGICVLWLSLAMTPAKQITGLPHWIAIRRALGLWAFAYISLHLIGFLVFWAGLQLDVILDEVSQRPYIIVGLLGWVMMVPLAVTSLNGIRRKMGKRWNMLHRLVYLVAILALLHLFWLSKLDFVQPIIFFTLLSVLFYKRFQQARK